jgi:hypothetical protein
MQHRDFDPSGSKSSILDVCICVTTHVANKNTSVNLNQECVSTILAIVSMLLHL